MARAAEDDYRAAAALAGGLKDAQREAAALKGAMVALETAGGAMDVDAGRRLAEGIRQATDRSNQLAAALAKTGRAGEDFAGNDARAAAQAKTSADERKKAEADASKASDKAEDERKKAYEKTNAVSRDTVTKAYEGSKKIVAGTLEAIKSVTAYGAALAGIHGAGDLANMAIGWRALGQLQMVSWKATMDLRQSVRGVDAQPLVRAVAALEKNLSKSTVTGNALSGILTRGFDATFGALERLEPVAESVLQGMVLGALEAEIGWQKIRGTLAPVTVALEEAFGDVDGLGLAAEGASIVFKAMAEEANQLALNIRAAYEVAQALGAVDLVKGTAAELRLVHQISRAAGSLSDDINARARRAVVPEDAPQGRDEANAPRLDATKLTEAQTAEAATGGEGVGKAVAAGIVKGMDDGRAAVRAAGERLGTGAVEGTKAATQVNSPSKLTMEIGRNLGEGEILGLQEMAPKVERAAAKALAPDVDAAGPGRSSAASAAPSSVSLTLVFPGIVSGDVAKVAEQGARAGLQEGLRQLTIAAGLPIPGART